jgi:predicted DNA-binding transcriptional regulator YafY
LLRSRRGVESFRSGASDGWERIRFPYTDPQPAAADIASFGAYARVERPPELAAAVAGMLNAAASALAAAAPDIDFGTADDDAASVSGQARRKRTSEDRLKRLLDLVPYIAGRQGVDLESAARAFGVTPTELARDIDLLVVSGPRHYPDGLVDISLEEGRVYITNGQNLAEPVRLSMDEACALIVGLEALRELPGAGSDAAVASALAKLAEAAGEAGQAGRAIATRLTEEGVDATLQTLQAAITSGERVRIRYLVPQRDQITDRVVEPVRAFLLDGAWYLEAWCTSAQGTRNFRLDRIQDAEPTGTPVEGHHEAGALPERLFARSDDDQHVVLVLDAPARWVAQRYDANRTAELDDGRLAAEIRVSSTSWIPGFLARLGGSATLAAPADLRTEAAAWLEAALRNYPAATSGD